MAGAGGSAPSGTHRPQLTSQYWENHAAAHSCVSVAQFSHVASGQSGSTGGGVSTQGLTTSVVPLLSAVPPPLPPLGASGMSLSGPSSAAAEFPVLTGPGPAAVLPPTLCIVLPAPAAICGVMPENGSTV